MDLKEMITKRRSFRKYTNEPVGEELLARIMAFAKSAKPLLPGIGVHMEVVTKEQVRFMLPWKTPQLIAIYSEPKEGYLENAGFILQQIDLYIQSLGLGSCWFHGKGRTAADGRPTDQYLHELLGYPAHYSVLASLVIGCIDEHPEPHNPEKLPMEKVHWETY